MQCFTSNSPHGKIVDNFNEAQERESHEESHDAATVGEEVRASV